MKFDDFTGEVQHRLELGTEGEAVRATRVVLTTLGERLGEGEASDLAGSLPMEIDRYLQDTGPAEQFGFQEFLDRVAEELGVDEAEALYQSQAIVALVAETTEGSEMDQVREQLPDGYADLFEFVGQSAEATPW
ncbi:MAG: DUF2267 domain-containing protein [Halobacteriaceae archaeon]